MNFRSRFLIHRDAPCSNAVYPFSHREKVPKGRMRAARSQDFPHPNPLPKGEGVQAVEIQG